MQIVTPKQLSKLLLNVALTRPVFIWGPPGIGKSALVEQFARDVGLDCVSLLGSQLAPEDLIGVPRIEGNRSVFCPPRMIAREEPYLLFVDELNACSFEVQKAFYSLINDRRLGEYRLPEGSVVVGAVNRAQDQAIVKPMTSELMNRMLEVELLASGCLSPNHARSFAAFVKQLHGNLRVELILQGDQPLPRAPEDRDVLYFVVQSIRAQLAKTLPPERDGVKPPHRLLVQQA